MPIIFVMSDRDLDVAHRAMQAGATDVVLRSNLSQVETLLAEAIQPMPLPVQTGRVLLVEDQASQARYIGQLCLKIGFEVVHCNKVDDAVEALMRDDFQLAIVDVVLQDIQSGLSLVRHIRQLAPPRGLLPILVMSGFDDIARRIEAIRIGADDFIAKPFADEEFVWRLQRIVQFHSSNDPDLPRLNSPDLLEWRQRGLSERESEICSVLLQGCSDKEIASKLQISFWTVRTHIGRIFNKLGVLNRRELMARFLSG
jgi:DNA-binding NarL/FixJ family response regulator